MLDQTRHIHFVGIKGVMMANLAVFLKEAGKSISGSDVKEEFITASLLKKNNIYWTTGFFKKNIPENTDLVVYSAAHDGTKNPQVAFALKKKIKVISQAELIGIIMNKYKKTIAVTGCHGKTTTSSLLAYALIKLKANPSYLVGTPYFQNIQGGNYSTHDYFVVEGDEYGINPPYNLTPKFSLLNPEYIICTNIDYDHPDVYKNIEEVKTAFEAFFAKKKLILCADNNHLSSIFKKLPRKQYSTFGFNVYSDLRIINFKTNKSNTFFELLYKKKSLGQFNLQLFGEKNVSNATGVILLLLQLGYSLSNIKKAIEDFSGATRRFQEIYHNENLYLFDDYGHHPKEIETTIDAAKNRFRKGKIIVIFQPHTYSRTKALLKEFSKGLSQADNAYVLPIFPSARENSSLFQISSLDIEKNSLKNNIKAVNSKVELLKLLAADILKSTTKNQPPTVIFTMGAGDVYKLKNDIINTILNVKSQSSKLT